jgi:hypothetical protein
MQTPTTLSVGGGEAIGHDAPHGGPGYEQHRQRRPAPEPEADAGSGQRLVIQQDARTGAYVYTVTDRDSGQVVAQVAREDVAKMADKAGYAAGSLIKAKA